MKNNNLIDKFDDIVIDNDGHKWSQVCEKHLKELENETSWFSSAPDVSVCGIEGCGEEADYYIDF